MDQSIRGFLRDMEGKGELLRIKKEVDPHQNLAYLQWECSNKLGKTPMFENLKGYPQWNLVGQLFGNRNKWAIAFDSNPETLIPDLVSRIEKGYIPCEMTSEYAPVKDIIETGPGVDLRKLPAIVTSEEDEKPFIASGMVIVKDPDTGIRNVSIHRLEVKGKDKTGLVLVPRQAWMIYEKYRSRNIPMPVAVVIGAHPAFYLAAAFTPPMDVDEYSIAGALLGEPVRMTKCETVDLEVPAEAEIVLEGEVPPDLLEEEGPFGEFTGLYASKGERHVINVKAITRRKDSIFFAMQCGLPVSDTQAILALSIETGIWKHVKNVEGYIDLMDVVVPPQSGVMTVVVKFRQRHEGQAKNVLAAALSSPYLHPKIAIAVDEDIDATDLGDVFWAVNTRVNPGRDIIMISGTRMHPLDWSSDSVDIPGSEYQKVASKMGIDATKPSLLKPVEREHFRKALPKGWKKVRIEDFLT